MIVTRPSRRAVWRARISKAFQDREIFVRTGGQVSFVKISARIQKQLAGGVAALVAVLLVVTTTAVARDLMGGANRAELTRQQAELGAAEAKVAAYQRRVGATAEELDARQAHLETLTREFIGANEAATREPAAAVKPTSRRTDFSAATIDPRRQLMRFAAIELRQLAYAEQLTRAAQARAARAEQAIRRFGIDPARLSTVAIGVGGPFEPYRAGGKAVAELGREVVALDRALAHRQRLEHALVAMPSASPADAAMESSRFGYRRDPFTGAAAFHSGIDFRGPTGTPIFAAAAGRIAFAGSKAGYGNTVEIDHGQGIVTRYAHLSRYDVRVGDKVLSGATIARMGSTGRSTGPHLHFEVRLNGEAMNPRTFLEANKDVLKVKAVAERRIVQRSAARGAGRQSTGA